MFLVCQYIDYIWYIWYCTYNGPAYCFADSAEKADYSYKDLLQELLNVGLRWQPAKAA